MRKGRLLVVLAVTLLILGACGKKEAAQVSSASSKEETSGTASTSIEEQDKKDGKAEEAVKKSEDSNEDNNEDNKVVDAVKRPDFDIIRDEREVFSTDGKHIAGTMSVAYLQLKDEVKNDYLNLSAAIDDINDESRKQYEAAISDFTVESRNYYDRNAEKNLGNGYAQCWNLRDVAVTRADEDFTSFFIREVNFWGGGEAADRYKCVNLNTQSGQAVELADVVADENGFGKAVEELFAKKYDVAINVIGKMPLSTFDWCLTPVGVNVYFMEEDPVISSACGSYLNIGFDAYPGVLNESFRPKNDDYVYPFNSGEDLYIDIDNDGSVNKLSFEVIVPENGEETNDCEGYKINVDDSKYNDFGETWFYDWQPYYVHTADGAYIYAYLGGYEGEKIDIIKFAGAKPEYEKSVSADNLFSREEPGRGDARRYRSRAFTTSKVLLKKNFAVDVCGEYLYQPVAQLDDDEGMGEWSFEIYEFDGKYYIEEMNNFYYGAGEIELLDDTPVPCTDGYSYRIKIHYFSGFAFAGDFQGSGHECNLIVHEDGSIVLTDGQPFDQGGDIILFPYMDNPIHQNMLNNANENLDCPEVIGAWRCSGTNDSDEKYENYLELRKNGTAVFVSKTETYPVEAIIGVYQVFNISDMHESTITFGGEVMGYACQPSEEMEFAYDTREDTLTFAPYGFDDADSVLEYHRTSEGEHDVDIVPGPASRVSEIEKNWEDYMSAGE